MNNVDELMILGGLDQPIQTDNSWVLSQIEEIVRQSIEKHDAYLALNACKQLIQVAKLSGLGLAKGLYLIKSNWPAYNMEEEFEEVAYVHIGLHPATIDRYVETFAMLESGIVPEDVKEDLQQLNIKSLIPIAKAWKQGYEISDDEWQELADAPDFNTIGKIIREDIKNKPPRAGSLMLVEDKIGTLWAFMDGERYFVGSLEVSSDEPAVQSAIERIRRNAGIMKNE